MYLNQNIVKAQYKKNAWRNYLDRRKVELKIVLRFSFLYSLKFSNNMVKIFALIVVLYFPCQVVLTETLDH